MADTPNLLTLQVVTPERTLIDRLEIKALVAPGSNGSLGILPDHAPLLTSLEIGVVKFKPAGSDRYEKMAISGGFLEVSENRAVILVDAAERAADIDVLRARQAKERAEARLRERSALVDTVRAELALRRATNRLRVADNGDA